MDDLWSRDWTVGLRVWMERSGKSVLGRGRLELLEAIDRHHSISEAARQLGMSYRHAWMLVQAANKAAGEALVITATGGSHGGGAQLTPQGRRVLVVFRELQRQLVHAAAGILPRLVQGPEPATIHVSAAASLEDVLTQLLAEYALLRPTVRVRAVFGASDELADHILAGAPADLFLAASPQPLDRLAQAGLVRPEGTMRLAKNTLVAIASPFSKPPVKRPRDLGRPEAGKVALADPRGPLGVYTQAFLDHQGLAEALSARSVVVDNSRSVVAAVRAGQADLGLVYGSDAATMDGCKVLFRIGRLPVPIHLSAALVDRGQEPEDARDLLNFLTSPAGRRCFRRFGFVPAPQSSGSR